MSHGSSSASSSAASSAACGAASAAAGTGATNTPVTSLGGAVVAASATRHRRSQGRQTVPVNRGASLVVSLTLLMMFFLIFLIGFGSSLDQPTVETTPLAPTDMRSDSQP